MDQSLLGSVLGHLAQMAERQGQLQRTQSEVLTELAQSLAADWASYGSSSPPGDTARDPGEQDPTSTLVRYHRPEPPAAPTNGPATTNTGPTHRCSCPTTGQAKPGAKGERGGPRSGAGA
ncbi:unnamed protein product [Boreogadus saida]